MNSLKPALMVLVLYAYSVGIASSANEAPPLQGSYIPEKVAENVYVIHGSLKQPNPENQGFMNNPGFIVTADGVVLIDSGGSVQIGRMVLEAIQSITDQPVVATFSTHIHGDHWLGNQAVIERFPDAVMYAHPKLIEAANGGQAAFWIDLMQRITSGATEGTRPVIPDVPVTHGQAVSIGEYQFSVHHHGKAHTESDIAIMVNPGNTLFTGDLACNKRLGRMDDGSFTGSFESLNNLIALEPEVVVPGHGQTGGVKIIEDMLELQQTLYSTVEMQFEEGKSDFEMKPAVLQALSRFSDWEGFEEGIGRQVSQSYLEVEQNNF